MNLHCDLDTVVLIALNFIGWGGFLFVILKDRVIQYRHTHPAH